MKRVNYLILFGLFLVCSIALILQDTREIEGYCPAAEKMRMSGRQPAETPPPPTATRPGLGVGLQPRFASLRTILSDGSQGTLYGLVERWEVWWSNNREKYLDFRQPIEWTKVVGGEGVTKSVTQFKTREQLLEILMKALEDSSMNVAWCAAVAAGKTGESSAIEPLKKAYQNDKRILVRNNSVLAMGMLGDKAALDFIKGIATDKKDDNINRSYAIVAMGFINDQVSIDTLKELIKSSDPKKETEVIACAAFSLGVLKDAASVPVLGELLNKDKKTDPRIRVYAALGLGRIGDKPSYDELKKAIGDKDNNVRAAIMVAFSVMPDAVDKKDLVPALKDKDPTVRGLAALTLAQIASKDDTKTKDQVYDELTDVLKTSKDIDTERLITLALGLLGNEKAKPELRKVLENKKKAPLAKAVASIALGLLNDAEAVPLMVELLKKESVTPTLAPYLILALGMIKDSKPVEEVVKPEIDKDKPATVPVKVETPKGNPAVNLLRELWAKADKNVSGIAYTNMAVALTMLGKRDELVIPQLIKHAAKDADPILRTYALHTIGLVGNREAAESFIIGYNDEKDGNVRNAAVNGIGFLLDKNPAPLLTKWTGDSVDIFTWIIEHLNPIQPW